METVDQGSERRVAITGIGVISSIGIGTPSCDWTETRIVKAVFGARALKIPVSAIRSMTGYAWAASEAFQVIATCLAITEEIVPPTLNYTTPDPNCDLDYVPNCSRRMRVGTAIVNQFGCGKNVVIILQRPQLSG